MQIVMKTKRLLSLLLTLALALGLLAPALASGSEVITVIKQPPGSVLVVTGDTLRLEAEVEKKIDGAAVELDYAWYDYAHEWGVAGQPPPIAYGPVLELTYALEHLLGTFFDFETELEDPIFCAVITHSATDADGEEYTVFVESFLSQLIPMFRPGDFAEILEFLVLMVAEDNEEYAALLIRVLTPGLRILTALYTPIYWGIRFAQLIGLFDIITRFEFE
jgi:hypothetical protein